ncbi:AMP-binding protein, partial [Streptomyces sp. PT12]|uniref:AMP-binding protein n=1 Tax=Streptomyces sp. PT12 TaxID=1510197 RepID=UPI000DE3615E
MLRTELIRPLPELIEANALRFGDKTAFRDDRRSVTYGQLAARTRRLAGHLTGLRLQPGDRAAIYLGNRVETVESYLAITRASAIGVPLNPRSTDAELAYLLDDSGARVLITDPAHAAQVRRVLTGARRPKVIVTGEQGVPAEAPVGALSFAALAETEPGAPARDDLGLDDLAWMLYTSGTTGKPKGVLSTQRNCLWSVAACYVPVPGLSADDRVIWPLPLFHSLAHIVCVLGVTAVGATARIVDGFAADDILEAIAEESATFLAGVPTLYHHLVQAANERGFHAPDLRMCLVGGAITTAALRQAFEETFDAPLLDAYGSTETCGSITINWPTGARVEGSCGLPVPGLGVRLVDPETGRDVPAGQEGEVWVSGPSVMAGGYHNQPEATAAALRDGWYRTGDLARRDEAGYFTVTGRIKEVIIRGGENIHPIEVEEVLRAVPGVADVAVAGKPHDVLGEVPVAYLVPGPEGLSPEALFAACQERLSYFKVPEELYEIDRVPRTSSGKVTRHALVDRPARLLATSSGHYETLFRTDWVPLPPIRNADALATAATDATAAGDTAGTPDAGGHWAVAGPDPLGVGAALTAAGLRVETFAEPGAVRDAVAGGATAPEVTVLGHPPAGDELTRVLTWWATDERLAATRLLVTTRRAVTTGTEPPAAATDTATDAAAQAATWGAVTAVQAAHPGRLLLADLDHAPHSAAALPAAAASGAPRVALRAGHAFHPRPAHAAPAPERDHAAALLDPRGTVVITGADGAAGAAVAHHLVAAHRARHLLLISQRGDEDPATARLAAELARAGADPTPAAADATDRAALAAALTLAPRPLTAVVHTQGEPGELSERELAALADGAAHLHALTRNVELASFTLLSPAAAPPAAPGRADHAAATAVLDALAHQRRALGLPALSLSWDPALPERERLAAFDAAHTTDQAALAATAAPLGAAPATAPRPAAGAANDDASGRANALRRELAELAPAARKRALLDLVRAEAAALRDLPSPEALGAERAFKELGFTSQTAVELRNRLVAATGLRISAAAAFDHPTPAALALHLRDELFGSRPAEAEQPPVTVAADEPIAIVGMACRLPGGVAS